LYLEAGGWRKGGIPVWRTTGYLHLEAAASLRVPLAPPRAKPDVIARKPAPAQTSWYIFYIISDVNSDVKLVKSVVKSQQN
jgi:hypothetical protein